MARFIVKIVLLASAVALSMVAVVRAIPDVNDYTASTRLKHDRLEVAGPKLVFVGGSSLAYGLDSERVEVACGLPVVNMGLNGWLGVRYMMAEVLPSLRAGDAVVLAFEHDLYVQSGEGVGVDLLDAILQRPANVRYMTPRQALAAVEYLPFAVSEKLARVSTGTLRSTLGSTGTSVSAKAAPTSAEASTELPPHDMTLSLQSAKLSGFTFRGDLTSHWDVKWRSQRRQGLNMTTLPLSQGVFDAIAEFATIARERHVRVALVPSPLLADFHGRHRSAVERLDARLAIELPDLPKVSMDRYVLPEHLFFDTVFHLNKEGRSIRTDRLLTDLQALGIASCQASN